MTGRARVSESLTTWTRAGSSQPSGCSSAGAAVPSAVVIGTTSPERVVQRPRGRELEGLEPRHVARSGTRYRARINCDCRSHLGSRAAHPYCPEVLCRRLPGGDRITVFAASFRQLPRFIPLSGIRRFRFRGRTRRFGFWIRGFGLRRGLGLWDRHATLVPARVVLKPPTRGSGFRDAFRTAKG